mmetsp:Transcript_20020/g.52264  ORF Transcript_20020/g.52264 Transcript_20020/m.52264 type:complete len:203 (-) Transcript_20020:223-831(-)
MLPPTPTPSPPDPPVPSPVPSTPRTSVLPLSPPPSPPDLDPPLPFVPTVTGALTSSPPEPDPLVPPPAASAGGVELFAAAIVVFSASLLPLLDGKPLPLATPRTPPGTGTPMVGGCTFSCAAVGWVPGIEPPCWVLPSRDKRSPDCCLNFFRHRSGPENPGYATLQSGGVLPPTLASPLPASSPMIASWCPSGQDAAGMESL